jgi:hypothetical protein
MSLWPGEKLTQRLALRLRLLQVGQGAVLRVKCIAHQRHAHLVIRVSAGRAYCVRGSYGGPCRDRTYDQEIKSLLLYQLS